MKRRSLTETPPAKPALTKDEVLKSDAQNIIYAIAKLAKMHLISSAEGYSSFSQVDILITHPRRIMIKDFCYTRKNLGVSYEFLPIVVRSMKSVVDYINENVKSSGGVSYTPVYFSSYGSRMEFLLCAEKMPAIKVFIESLAARQKMPSANALSQTPEPILS